LTCWTERLRALSWSTFAFTLPAGWEITSYLAPVSHGQFQFHRRERVAGQLHWQTAPAAPDQRRTLLAMHAAADVGAPHGASPLQLAERGPWLLGSVGGRLVHASLYQPETRLLIRWRFPVAQSSEVGNDDVLWPLLDSYRANTAPTRLWQVFGVGVALPLSFTHASLSAQAVDVSVGWVGGKRRHLIGRCIGMDEQVLATMTLQQLARVELHRDGARVVSSEASVFHDAPAVRTTFLKRAESGAEALLGRPWRGESLIWHDRAVRRIYALIQWGPDASDALDFADLTRLGGDDVIAPPTPAVASTAPEPPSCWSANDGPSSFDRLRAIPVRNQRATVHPRSAVCAEVTVPQRFPRALAGLAARLGARTERRFQLEGVGLALFLRLNAALPLRDHVEWLAAAHQLSFHEARVLVMKYLEMLMGRGLIAIAVPAAAVPAHQPSSREKGGNLA